MELTLMEGNEAIGWGAVAASCNFFAGYPITPATTIYHTMLSTCRRNIDLTLLVLNNFNYGMTGGQCSSTTPQDAVVGSGFLNRLEKPVDICQVAGAAGAAMVSRASTYQKDLVEVLKEAIAFDGFSLVDIWGICPGRYTRRKKMLTALSPETVVIKAAGVELPPSEAVVIDVDFKKHNIKSADWALASLAVLARQNRVLTMDMFTAALKLRFKKTVFEAAMAVAEMIAA